MHANVHKCAHFNATYNTCTIRKHTDLGSGDGVDKGGLLEAMVAGSDSYLPARVDHLIDHLARDLLLTLALVSLHIQLHILLETLHLHKVVGVNRRDTIPTHKSLYLLAHVGMYITILKSILWFEAYAFIRF